MKLDLSDDYQVFDNLTTLVLKHKSTDVTIDRDIGTFTNEITELQLEGCLIRQVSKRNAGSVRQIFERGKSITSDSVQLTDTIVEIPAKSIESIEIGDELTDMDNGQIYGILAYDLATLSSRYRCACRTL